MPVDSLTLAALLTEAKPLLVGGRLTALNQPERGVLSLGGRSPEGDTWHWRADLRDGVARAHLSASPLVKGTAPPWLVQMRKHVEGARILDVTQAPWERVLRFHLAGRDALGDPRPYALIVEIVGRYSLACLVDLPTNTLIATSRLVDETMSRYRQIAPGLPYALPPGAGDRRNLAACTDDELAVLCEQATEPYAAWIGRTFSGLGKDRLARLTDGLHGPESKAELTERLRVWRDAWKLGHWHWRADGEPRAEVGAGVLDGLNTAIDQYYQVRLAAEALQRLQSQLRQHLTAQQTKLAEQLADLEHRWRACERADRLQQEAELLQGNLYRIVPGVAEVSVEDYFDPAYPTITLGLDPDRSPADNVQQRFRAAQKAQRQREHLQRQREALQTRSWELDEIATRLEQNPTRNVLEDLADSLLSDDRTPADNGRKEAPEPERYRSSEGLTILVGRSSRQNEVILHDLSRGHDLWLHAQNIPGAHVLIKIPKGTSVPNRTLEEAACLAAFFSKARHSTHVPVVAVERRFVRQPKGAAAGFVHYSNETALWVDPSPDVLPTLADS